MADEVLLSERLRRLRPPPAIAEEVEDEDDDPDGYRAFALVRGMRQHALMLELRLRTGDSVALAYPWLREVRFDRSGELLLMFDPQLVTIRGRRLEALHAGVLMHRARWVWEADRAAAELVPEGEPLVEEVSVRPV